MKKKIDGKTAKEQYEQSKIRFSQVEKYLDQKNIAMAIHYHKKDMMHYEKAERLEYKKIDKGNYKKHFKALVTADVLKKLPSSEKEDKLLQKCYKNIKKHLECDELHEAIVLHKNTMQHYDNHYCEELKLIGHDHDNG